MSLWLLLTFLVVWAAICAMAVALCMAAARGDRDEVGRWLAAGRARIPQR